MCKHNINYLSYTIQPFRMSLPVIKDGGKNRIVGPKREAISAQMSRITMQKWISN